MPLPRSLAHINKPEFNPTEVRRAPGRCWYPANPDSSERARSQHGAQIGPRMRNWTTRQTPL